MSRPFSDDRKETLEDGVLQSLCYLHQETLRGNQKELARVLQTAIEQSELVIPASVSLSSDSNNLLQQFYPEFLEWICPAEERTEGSFAFAVAGLPAQIK